MANVIESSPKDRRPIVISGPSGVGKGTLIDKLKQAFPGVFVTTVSHTTRKPRTGEVEGKAYYFVSESEFSDLISRDEFIEHTIFSHNHYGTSKRTVTDQAAKGSVVLLDIELQGAKAVKADPGMEARFVFIKPPSFDILESRLQARSTDTEEAIARRLLQARVELDFADGHPEFFDKVIVNGDVETAFEELSGFIYQSESGKESPVEVES